MDRSFVRAAGFLLSLMVAFVCPSIRAAPPQRQANPARISPYLAAASTTGQEAFFNTARPQAARLDTPGQTVFYGPPYYQVAYSHHGPWPSIAVAIQMYWVAYQEVWQMPQCTYTPTYYSPYENNGFVVWIDLGNGCGGDAFIVYATKYSFGPGKNNGDPGGCCSAGASAL